MKSTIQLCICLMMLATSMGFKFSANPAAPLQGSWKLQSGSEEQVLIFMDGYVVHTTFDKMKKNFIQTRGGTYSFDDKKLIIQYEFDTRDKEQVGKKITYKAKMDDEDLETEINGHDEKWTLIDDGSLQLSGLWKITARRQGDKIVPIHQSGTRKTIKILSSTRFQWAAIDPGTRQFMGTGGGTYTFENGKYTENIEFFSRDSTRVGQSLIFDGKLENGEWHHSGFSSKGDPIYEVWGRRDK